MKKVLFILLVALIPLTVLTFGSVVEFMQVPPRSVPDDTALLGSVQKSSNLTLSRVRFWKNVFDAIEATELLIPSSEKVVESIHSTGMTGNFIEKFEKWNSCSTNISEYLGILAQFRMMYDRVQFQYQPEDLRQLRSTKQDYDLIVERFQTLFPPGKMASLLEKQGEELQIRIEEAEKNAEAQTLLADARNAFKLEDFETARDKCNTLLTDYAKVLENKDQVRTSVIELKARAEVYVGSNVLDEIRLSSSSLEERLEKINEFVESLEGLDQDEMDESDKNQLAQFRKEAQELRSKIMEEKHSDILESSVDSLRDLSDSLPNLLTQAVETLRGIDEFQNSIENDDTTSHEKKRELIQQRKEVCDFVRRAIRKKFPEISYSGGKGLQEAVMQDGSVRRGFFKPVKDDGKVVGFKCYPTAEELAKPTVSVGTLRLEEFKEQPGDPIELKMCEQYATERATLIKSPTSHGAWIDLLNHCQKWESQLREREKETGTTIACSFKRPIALAKFITKDENWKKIIAIFE